MPSSRALVMSVATRARVMRFAYRPSRDGRASRMRARRLSGLEKVESNTSTESPARLSQAER